MNVNEMVTDTDVRGVWGITTIKIFTAGNGLDEIRQKVTRNTRSTMSNSGNRMVRIKQKGKCVHKLFLNIFWNNITP